MSVGLDVHREVGRGLVRVAAELPRPQFVAVGVVFADEDVPEARRGLAWEGPGRSAGDIHCGGPHCESRGSVRRVSAELAAPQLVAVVVVLTDEGVIATRRGLAGQGGVGRSRHVHTRAVRGHSGLSFKEQPRRYLGRPQLVAFWVVLAEVGAAYVGSLQVATEPTRHVHAGSVDGHRHRRVRLNRAVLPGPENTPVAVVLADVGVAFAHVELRG